MKPILRWLLLWTLVAGMLTAGAHPASACSCVPLNARHYLADADGAFVGELVARKDPVPTGNVVGPGISVFTFRVERAVKGDLGELVQVESQSQGEACGLEVSTGTRTGLFLMRQDNRWTSNLCLQVGPSALIAAAKANNKGGDAAQPAGEPQRTSGVRPIAKPVSGRPVWPWVVAAGVLLAVGAGMAIRGRRRSGPVP